SAMGQQRRSWTPSPHLPGNDTGRDLQGINHLGTDKTAQVIIAGHAFMQNLRRGHYELAVDAPAATRVAAAFAELARAI
ncbi:hypothetical protein ACGFI8_47225, partial [Dactylosporangium sp. NPDC048998]